jgi:hypothetical protein
MRSLSPLRGYVVSGLALAAIVAAPAISWGEEPVTEVVKPKSKGTVSAILSALKLSGGSEATAASETTTHKQTAEIVIRTSDGKGTLQTFCVGPDGNLYAVVTAPVVYGAGVELGRKGTGEIHVYSPQGKKLRHWVTDFEPQRIAAAASGELYVGGSGKLAKFDAHGKQLAAVESPHLAAVLSDKEKLVKDAEEQRKQMIETYANAAKQMEDVRKQLIERKAQLEKKATAKKPADDVPADKPAKDGDEDVIEAVPLFGAAGNSPAALDRQIKQYDQILKSYQQQVEQQKKQKVEDIVSQISARLQRIHAITVGEKDVYVATAMSKGYGYAVWRMGLDFSGAEQITEGLSGCCGQMDIQARGDELFVAENSRHRVLKFSRDGKKLAQFGNRERAGNDGGFGGCCNPMNLCFTSGGEVLTAESEGKVRCFSPEGKYVGLCGAAKVSGGCKNVAVGTSPDGKHIFFYDLGGSKIIVMTRELPSAEEQPAVTNKVGSR